jgi:hypothetical protein
MTPPLDLRRCAFAPLVHFFLSILAAVLLLLLLLFPLSTFISLTNLPQEHPSS